MTDIWFILLTIILFCIAAGFVIACNKIIGPDPELSEELDVEHHK